MGTSELTITPFGPAYQNVARQFVLDGLGEHWGYNEDPKLLDAPWFAHMRDKCGAWGGNFLVDVGPAPDGTMSDKFYQVCGDLAGRSTSEDHDGTGNSNE